MVQQDIHLPTGPAVRERKNCTPLIRTLDERVLATRAAALTYANAAAALSP